MAGFFGRMLGRTGPAPDPAQAEDAMMLTRSPEQPMIGRDAVKKAQDILTRYKQGKASLERRIIDDELWWQIRHWEAVDPSKRPDQTPDGLPHPRPTSAWLFNVLISKHADMMDNYPEPVVLPREQSDERAADLLSEVLPVIMDACDYNDTYDANAWEKVKHGTSVTMVSWDPEAENGIGDIRIKPLDLLKIYWEPGITDVQDSKNLFIVDLLDKDLLREQYPNADVNGTTLDVARYRYDESIDTTDKVVVVDWYYKVRRPDGRKLLHYVKFCGDSILYASENDPNLRDTGWYQHGLYPVVFDTMYPEKGTPAGFGLVSVCKDPQLYIDQLSAHIQQTAMMGSKKRWFIPEGVDINPRDFLDWEKPFVPYSGAWTDDRVHEITVRPLDGIYFNVLQAKIEEMKETSSNRDVTNGSTTSGVTAASAISALQEAGNKNSRDIISASYRANSQIFRMVIELIRQYYDVPRTFRITGQQPGSYQFVGLDNSSLRDQPAVGADGQPIMDDTGEQLMRHPVFDLKVSSQKRNPFSRMEANERAMQLYGAGFYNPERAQEALLALEMMDFEGIDKVREEVAQGQTLLNVCQQMSQQLDQMAMLLQALTGKDMGLGEAVPAADGGKPSAMADAMATGNTQAGRIMQSRMPQSGYTQRLVKRSAPSVDGN